jgi:hypothetical protein
MEIIKTTEELLSNLSGKESMRTLSEALSSNVEFGLTNPLEFRIKAKILIESLQNAIKQTEDSCMTELDKYSNGKAEVFGSRAERVEAGVTYDFSECNHPRYNDILWQMEALEEEKKAIETFLKSLTGRMQLVDEETGSIEIIFPPIKKSKTTIKITLR